MTGKILMAALAGVSVSVCARAADWNAEPTEGRGGTLVGTARGADREAAARETSELRSVTAYDCDVQLRAELPPRERNEKRTLLAEGVTGNVGVQDAWIELGIDAKTKEIHGRVGSEAFRGPLPTARFRSASWGSVVVDCKEPTLVPYLLKYQFDDLSKSTELFSLDPAVNRDQAIHGIMKWDLDYNTLCYLGDPQAALAAASRLEDVSKIVSADGKVLADGTLAFSYPSEDCLHSHPYWGGDVCDEGAIVTRVHARTVKACPVVR